MEDPLNSARADLARALVSQAILPDDRRFLEQAVAELVSREVLEKFYRSEERARVEEAVPSVSPRSRAKARTLLGTALVNRVLLKALVLNIRATGTVDPRALPSWKRAWTLAWILVGVQAFIGAIGSILIVEGLRVLLSPVVGAGFAVDRLVGVLLLLMGALPIAGMLVQGVRDRTNLSLARRMVRAYELAARGASLEGILNLLDRPL